MNAGGARSTFVVPTISFDLSLLLETGITNSERFSTRAAMLIQSNNPVNKQGQGFAGLGCTSPHKSQISLNSRMSYNDQER